MTQKIKDILSTYHLSPVAIMPYGAGHVHRSFRCQLANHDTVLLQQINTQVFHDVPALMHNIAMVCKHLGAKYPAQLWYTPDGQSYVERAGEYWRVSKFVNNTHSVDQADSTHIAQQAGQAFGEFVSQLASLQQPLLTTISHFHHLPSRLDQLKQVIQRAPNVRRSQVKSLIRDVEKQAPTCLVLQRLCDQGRLPMRVIHNDTKLNNVLFDPQNQAVCVVDLDTVMPGMIHFDFADALRIITNTAAEDEPDTQKVDIDFERFKAFCLGYLPPLQSTLTALEKETLSLALPLMPYMLSIRFLTDYLLGDRYFKIDYPEHNLVRANAQMVLAQKMQAAQEELDAFVVFVCSQ